MARSTSIPFVATNVGSCREIIEGRSDEQPALGAGGIITPVVAPAATADAVERLLRDHDLRADFGETLRQRVRATYTSERATKAYTDLCRDLRNQPSRTTQPLPLRARAGTSLWTKTRRPA